MKMMRDVPSGTKNKIEFLLGKKIINMKMMRDVPSGKNQKIEFLIGVRG